MSELTVKEIDTVLKECVNGSKSSISSDDALRLRRNIENDMKSFPVGVIVDLPFDVEFDMDDIDDQANE